MATKTTAKQEEAPEVIQESCPVIGTATKVRYTAPRIPNEKDQPDLIVSVNGKNYVIQRGKEVLIPKNVADVIKASLKNAEKAEEYYYSVAK